METQYIKSLANFEIFLIRSEDVLGATNKIGERLFF